VAAQTVRAKQAKPGAAAAKREKERPLRFDPRMTPAEALMWTLERDPILRSSFLNVTLLEGTADFARFRRRMETAVEKLPRLKQRVRGGSPPQLSWPQWVDDDSFDLDYHVRHVALPQPGSIEQFLELAAVEAQDNFDLARPLWTIWIVEGLDGGRSALMSKMHHTITDGVGGVRLSAQFIDIEPNPADAESKAGTIQQAQAQAKAAGRPQRGLIPAPLQQLTRMSRTTATLAANAVRHPAQAVELGRSILRQALVTESARSPLWSGKRGLARHFEILSFDLDEAKQAAHNLGGTLNDLFVAGVAGGVGAYHESQGRPVNELRMSMPISTRQDGSAGGNAFAPARILVPVGIVDPAERFKAVAERIGSARHETSLGIADELAGLITALPAPILVRFARQQVQTVDFATSNVRGAPFDLYIAGARILANHPFGPTAGTAFNATVLSYKGSMDVGISCDPVAVSDPGLLRQCIEDGLQATIKAGA
jgi:diacylglycerol O-acyltransferase / wax synthase